MRPRARQPWTSRLAACAAALLTILPAASSAAPPYLSLTPTGGKYTSTVDLNDAGRYAVNNFGPEIPVEPAYISSTPINEDVGSLGGAITRIRAINNKGEAIGISTTADGAEHFFLYSSGHMQDLSALYGIGAVVAINDRGDITGQSGDLHAVVIRNERVEVAGPANTAAGAINQAGDILVGYYMGAQVVRTCVYSNGQCRDLPLFGGAAVLGSAINDVGWVAGNGAAGENRQHASFYDGETMADLTPAAALASAWDINNLGHVVGDMDNRAFLYADGRLIDLNTLVDPDADLLLTSAFAINNREQILARACDRTGVFCYGTVLLDTIPQVPEPPAVAMWLAAAAGVAALRTWRR